jgi:hypothetical protein
MSDAESEALQFDPGEVDPGALDAPGTEKPAKKPDDEVRAEGEESADDAGEPEGEPPESDGDKPEGEESEGDPDVEADFKTALRMARGDPKKALEILRAAYPGEARGEAEAVDRKPGEAVKLDPTIEKSITERARRNVEQFIADKGTEDKPGDERKAFADTLARLHVDIVRDVMDVLGKHDERSEERVSQQRADAALWKEYPEWEKDRAAYARFLAEVPSRAKLPPVDSYELFLARRAKLKKSPATGTKAAPAADKARMARATEGLQGGRPAGPTTRKHISTSQREASMARQSLSSALDLP